MEAIDRESLLQPPTNTNNSHKKLFCGYRRAHCLAGFAAVLVLVACLATFFALKVDDPSSSTPASEARWCGDVPPLSYPWPIPADANWTTCEIAGVAPPDVLAQCLSVEVPMSWFQDSPGCQSSVTIPIFLKRIYMGDPASSTTTQVWNIPGGAGGPSSGTAGLESLAVGVVYGTGGLLAFYQFDKRGTGESSFLSCTPSILFLSDLDACLAQLKDSAYAQDRLATTTYSQTAQDVIFLMEVVDGGQDRTQRRVVVGNSNGGFLTQRIISILGPEQSPLMVDGYILNSSPAANHFNITENFLNADAVALDVVSQCEADPHCMAQFSALSDLVPSSTAISPTAAKNEFLRLGSQGQHPCINKLGTSFVDLSWAMSSELEVPGSWELIPVLLLRLARCGAADLDALGHFVLQIPETQPPDLPLGLSLVVEYAINWSENWFGDLADGDSPEAICARVAAAESLTFVSYKTGSWFCEGWSKAYNGDGGPNFLHAPDKWTGSVPDVSSSSLLYILGLMDSALDIPSISLLAASYSLANPSGFTFVPVPRAGHTVADASPLEGTAVSCGNNVIWSAALSSTLQPDLSCVPNIVQLDFEGNSELLVASKLRYFNLDSSSDMWTA